MKKPKVSYLKKFISNPLFLRILPIGLIVAVWLCITENGWIRPLFIPGISHFIKVYQDMAPYLLASTGMSLLMIFTGFFIGTAWGIISGLLMAYSRVSYYMFGGILDFIRPVPILALIPLFVIWFGIGIFPQVALIVLGCSIILGVNTTEAIHNVPRLQINAALTLGANRKQIYRTMIIPMITPNIIGAIRLSAATSFGLDMAAEFIGAQIGLGYMMIVYEKYLRTEGILAVVLIISIIAYITDITIAKIEKKLTRWTERRMKSVGMGI